MTSVLIVDDSKTARLMLKHWINNFWPGFEIVEAGNGDEALTAMNKLDSSDLLAVVDYNMPGMTGLDLVAKMISSVAPSKITLCTANIQEAVKKRARQMGIHYIAKPITPTKVKAAFSNMDI